MDKKRSFKRYKLLNEFNCKQFRAVKNEINRQATCTFVERNNTRQLVRDSNPGLLFLGRMRCPLPTGLEYRSFKSISKLTELCKKQHLEILADDAAFTFYSSHKVMETY
jgi:hypothetical protein